MAESFFDRVHKQDTHVPDVLSCLSNLSNDEVFTPPEIVNQMLDMIPQELFASTETTFLDPACKTGVFLREIAKRLLNFQLPFYQDRMNVINEKKANNIQLSVDDEIFLEKLQKAIDNIFHKQLFGIAITELTSLLSRRSVYCSKYPNGPYSITQFDDAEGNIRYRRIKHSWDKKGRCVFCGTSAEGELGVNKRGEELETHAYEFIHTLKPEEIWNMKFDVIISNPPYQIEDGGHGSSSSPLYHQFVNQAKKMQPTYISMIIPARWFSGGKGLDDFRSEMLTDGSISELHDFFDSADCFPGVDISGGVCYFLWKKGYDGDCRIVSHRDGKTTEMKRLLLEKGSNSFIRFNEAVSIVRKIKDFNESSFMDIVSSRKPFGLSTTVKIKQSKAFDDVKIYAYPNNGYISRNNIIQNNELVHQYKVYIAKAYGERGSFPYLVIGKPFLGEPETCCSETYLTVGGFDSKKYALNVISYMQTKFFRFLVLLKKNTQNSARGVYEFVPVQDFSKPWTDDELYEKYNLSQEEIDFIESMIRPMDNDGGEADG